MEESVTQLNTAEILAGTRTFKRVSGETIALLVERSDLRVIPAGGTLFRPDDVYRKTVYILVDGDMVVQRENNLPTNVRPGDFVGLANYLDQHNYSSTVLATTESVLLEIESDLLFSLEQEQADLSNALNRVIAAKLRDRSPDRSITTGALAQPVSRVMKSPVAACGPETTLRGAFQLMNERKIGSLVVKDKNDKLLGVLTYAGLAETMLLEKSRPDDSIMKAACELPRVIKPDTPLWEAEESMKRYAIKYLIVVEDQAPVGIVSQSDIVRSLISRPDSFNHQIGEAKNFKELILLTKQLATTATDAQETNYRPSDAVRLLTETHLTIQRRAIELTLEWMKNKGYERPDVDFSIIVMGSGGRKEMLLNPDQDNGIIIEDTPISDEPDVNDWFDRFCRRMNKDLDRVGYMLCPGEIMARNPMYHKTLSQWKKQITHITQKPTEKAARWGNVVLDFDTLYGNDQLTTELRRHVLAEVHNRPRLLKMMADHDAEGKPAIGFFNQLITTTKDEQGEWIDIKRNGLRIIADAARIFALQTGIAVQNTTDRLNALVRVGKLSPEFRNSVQDAYEELLDLLLTHQIEQHREGNQLNKLIDPEKLTPQSRSTLMMAMRAVKQFQERLEDDYATSIF